MLLYLLPFFALGSFIDLHVSEPSGVRRVGWLVSSGVGVARYFNVLSTANLFVTDDDGALVEPVQFNILACWGKPVDFAQNACEAPIRVVKVSFLATFNASQTRRFKLHYDEPLPASATPPPPPLAVDGANEVTIDNGLFVATMSKQHMEGISTLRFMNAPNNFFAPPTLYAGLYVRDANGNDWTTSRGAPTYMRIEDNGPVSVTVYQRGFFYTNNNPTAFGSHTVYAKNVQFTEADVLSSSHINGAGKPPCVPSEDDEQEAATYPRCRLWHDAASPTPFVTIYGELRIEFVRLNAATKITAALTNRGGIRGHSNGNSSQSDTGFGNWQQHSVELVDEYGLRLPTLHMSTGASFEVSTPETTASQQASRAAHVQRYVRHRVNTRDEVDNFVTRTLIGSAEVERTSRAPGLLSMRDAAGVGGGLVMEQLDFWQRFPSSIAVDRMTPTWRFMPDTPPSSGEAAGLFRWPAQGANTENAANPHEFPTTHIYGQNLPNIVYSAPHVYNLNAGMRSVNVNYFAPSQGAGLDRRASLLLSEAMRAPLLLVHSSPRYLADCNAMGEIGVAHVEWPANHRFPYYQASNEHDALPNEVNFAWWRHRTMQIAAFVSGSYDLNEATYIKGRSSYRRSNRGVAPGVDTHNQNQQERRRSGYDDPGPYGAISWYGKRVYGEVMWAERRYSNLHYDIDGSAGRTFLSSGDYTAFEWLHAGARMKSDSGTLHVEVPDINGQNSDFVMMSNVFESAHAHSSFQLEPPGYPSHTWEAGMRQLYLITGDRFARQSLLRRAGNLLVHYWALDWSDGCARCSARIVRSLIDAYQATGRSVFYERAKYLIRRARQKQQPNGHVPGSTLYQFYMAKGITNFWLESVTLGKSTADVETLTVKLADHYRNDLFTVPASGTRDAYRLLLPFEQTTPYTSAYDLLWIAANMTGDLDYVRFGRQTARDFILYHCSQTAVHNVTDTLHSPTVYFGDYCRSGAIIQFAAGSQSKEGGWLWEGGAYARYAELLLGATTVSSLADAKPVVHGVEGLPTTAATQYPPLTITVNATVAQPMEVRIEFARNGVIRALLCYDDGGVWSPHPMNVDRNANPQTPNKLRFLGPTFNERTPSLWAGDRPSGDAVAGDGIFTCMANQADAPNELPIDVDTHMTVFVEDMRGFTAEAPRHFVPAAAWSAAQDAFDAMQTAVESSTLFPTLAPTATLTSAPTASPPSSSPPSASPPPSSPPSSSPPSSSPPSSPSPSPPSPSPPSSSTTPVPPSTTTAAGDGKNTAEKAGESTDSGLLVMILVVALIVVVLCVLLLALVVWCHSHSRRDTAMYGGGGYTSSSRRRSSSSHHYQRTSRMSRTSRTSRRDSSPMNPLSTPPGPPQAYNYY